MLVPALISVLLYERFKGYVLSTQKRFTLMFIFAFLINLVWFALTWARGWAFQSWASDGGSSWTSTIFVLQYMVISLVSAVVLAFILSLVRVSKRNSKEESEDQESAQ
jgi:quinol-cytochrome oxidoreductase complex cytochrome b subunit